MMSVGINLLKQMLKCSLKQRRFHRVTVCHEKYNLNSCLTIEHRSATLYICIYSRSFVSVYFFKIMPFIGIDTADIGNYRFSMDVKTMGRRFNINLRLNMNVSTFPYLYSNLQCSIHNSVVCLLNVGVFAEKEVVGSIKLLLVCYRGINIWFVVGVYCLYLSRQQRVNTVMWRQEHKPRSHHPRVTRI